MGAEDSKRTEGGIDPAGHGRNAANHTLKSCPLCAGSARLDPMPRARNWWRVQCSAYECGATTWAMEGPWKAIAAWNRRPPDGPQ